MIDTKALATALHCVNLVHRHRATLDGAPSEDDLTTAWMRLEWALRSAYVKVDHDVVVAERPIVK